MCQVHLNVINNPSKIFQESFGCTKTPKGKKIWQKKEFRSPYLSPYQMNFLHFRKSNIFGTWPRLQFQCLFQIQIGSVNHCMRIVGNDIYILWPRTSLISPWCKQDLSIDWVDVNVYVTYVNWSVFASSKHKLKRIKQKSNLRTLYRISSLIAAPVLFVLN